MPRSVDYYFAPQSPWTYLGHERFARIVRDTGARVNVRPVDLGAVFKVSGGLPLAQRPAQRRAYRLVELRRFAEHLKLPMNIEPKFFPVSGDAAARLIIAVDLHDGSDAAMKISGAVFRAVWAQQRDIANAQVLAELLAETGLSPERLANAGSDEVQDRYATNTQAAIDAGVFGAPSYVMDDGEIFWGQDRLDFVERRLAAG